MDGELRKGEAGEERWAGFTPLIEAIELGNFSMLTTDWDDATDGATNADLREALLKAVAMGRVDIVELFVAKLGMELVLALAPDALALAMASGNKKMLRMMASRGWLRRSARRNSRLLAADHLFGDLPSIPSLNTYGLGNFRSVAVLFLGGSAITFLCDAAGGITTAFTNLSDRPPRDDMIHAMSSESLKAFCGQHAKVANFGTISKISVMAVDASDLAVEDTGYLPMHEAILARDEGSLVEAIRAGSNVNAQDEEGNTPLHVAAAMGDLKATEALIAAGADAFIVNAKGFNPMDISREQGACVQREAMAHSAVHRQLEQEVAKRSDKQSEASSSQALSLPGKAK